jgi:zinc-ribbon domain
MTVSCPSCDTVYRVPPRSQLDEYPTFRCSRCDHVFGPDDGAEEPLPPPAPRPQRAAHGVPDDTEAEEPEGADDGAETTPRRRSSARFALRAVVVVTLGFALLSIYVFMHRARVTEVLAQVPVVGPDLVALRLNPAHVQLTDVRGQFTRAHGDSLVFVITGRAINNAPVPVSAIEIQGSITGTREQHRLVYAGAAPHHVDDLSQREIELLQTLQPPETWRLLPGEEGDFLVAFVDPPVPLRNFAVEVASVRRRRLVVTEQ